MFKKCEFCLDGSGFNFVRVEITKNIEDLYSIDLLIDMCDKSSHVRDDLIGCGCFPVSFYPNSLEFNSFTSFCKKKKYYGVYFDFDLASYYFVKQSGGNVDCLENFIRHRCVGLYGNHGNVFKLRYIDSDDVRSKCIKTIEMEGEVK